MSEWKLLLIMQLGLPQDRKWQAGVLRLQRHTSGICFLAPERCHRFRICLQVGHPIAGSLGEQKPSMILASGLSQRLVLYVYSRSVIYRIGAETGKYWRPSEQKAC